MNSTCWSSCCGAKSESITEGGRPRKGIKKSELDIQATIITGFDEMRLTALSSNHDTYRGSTTGLTLHSSSNSSAPRFYAKVSGIRSV